jgi:Putative peptidoglycan binding domain
MAIRYEVLQGDCISSIAFEHGFFPDTIWNHPNNAALKGKRKDPNVLLPGDIVFVPDRRLKELPRPTEHLHKFRCKAVPEKLKLQLLLNGVPRAQVSYELTVDDELVLSGKTDSQGRLEHSIPPNARTGKLIVNDEEAYELLLGELDPADDITGIQGRLRHLGFYDGPIEGQVTPEMEQALQEFQLSAGLEPDGATSQQTVDALKKAYGG